MKSQGTPLIKGRTQYIRRTHKRRQRTNQKGRRWTESVHCHRRKMFEKLKNWGAFQEGRDEHGPCRKEVHKMSNWSVSFVDVAVGD